MPPRVNIFWFRRDLRLHDNAGLYQALNTGIPVVPVFIFDTNILDELEDKKDGRVEFIHNALRDIQHQLNAIGSGIDIRHGDPQKVFEQLLKDYDVAAVYTNNDYESYGINRDQAIAELLKARNIPFYSFKDQVIFEKQEVTKDDGQPYTVFTPYSRKWKSTISASSYHSFPSEKLKDNFLKHSIGKFPSLKEIGFERSGLDFPPSTWTPELIEKYKENRDLPGIEGTSRLSVHLRFGTISIRQLAKEAASLNETFLNELIWREFYQMILWHFPRVVYSSFKQEYDQIEWRNNEKEFEAWCRGTTGYPIIDAGMRELNSTGFMHNRVRMIVASFLTKHLLIDWRWGEAYFAKKLLDYDLASNSGGWQWAAGSGCDAAPYFRVFNPYLQTEKFDPAFKYISKWVPEWQELKYPLPIIEHKLARERCLKVYAAALKKDVSFN